MNEMTNEQLIELSVLTAQPMPIQEVKVKILFICLNAQFRRMKNPNYFRVKIDGETYAVTADEVTAISAAFDFLYIKPDEKGNCFLDMRLTRCPYPVLKIKGTEFFAPDSNLTDMLYNQYIYLQSFDQAKDKKPEVIYQWLGAMFRTNKEKFNHKDLNLELMKHINPHVVVLMLWFWIGSCRFLAEKFPRVFPDGNDPEYGDVYSGQQRLLDYMAKGDPEKKRAYKQDMLYDILYSLDYILEIDEQNSDSP